MPTRRRPNILITQADDQRFDAARALGTPQLVTPHLDRMTREGIACTRACIMGSTHGAVCAPSRAMLHTGMGLWRVPTALSGDWGIHPDDRVPDSRPPLLPQLFREAGYRTFATGKWHIGKEAFARSFSDGGKIFFGGMADHERTPVFDFDPAGLYPQERQYIGEKFSTDLFADQAVRFLESHSGNEPFYLYVGFTAPHDPRTPPPRFASLYPPGSIELPPNVLPEHPFDNGELRVRDELLCPFPRTRERIAREVADYYGMISHMDDAIGRIHAALAAAGHADDTIVVHLADHGLAVGQHGLLGKQNLYDHSTRVPLLLRGPGIPVGQRTDALCYLHDLFPTLLDLANLPTPPTNEARSLAPLIRGETSIHRETVFSAYKHEQRAVRDERFKLIEYFVAGSRRTQLFDIATDPWETRDLSADPAHGSTVARLRRTMSRWQDESHDPLKLRPTA
ncbi:MAG: sulfatase-like hydrolase/transferase [Planctomycetota bacterium]|nr:sulfatase-like hydrolase/transferase [Planctomycetota bacterium]